MKKILIVSAILAMAFEAAAPVTYAREAGVSADLSEPEGTLANGAVPHSGPLPAGPMQAYAPLGGADLERAFWVCDYAATTRGVSATPVELCGAVYEELKNTKFRGDFSELLLWWKENRRAEHQKFAGDRIESVEHAQHR